MRRFSGENLKKIHLIFFFNKCCLNIVLFSFIFCNCYITVGDSPPFGGRGIPFYLSQFVSILGNLYPDRGIKGSFLGMFGKMDLCKEILIQAYTSLI